MSIALEASHVSKLYQLGSIGTRSILSDIKSVFVPRKEENNPDNEIWALKDVSFQLPQGEVVGVVGKNGSGKSTLLKVLSRTTAPTTGNITIKGKIASLLEVGTGFHPELTGRENIFLNGAIMGMSKTDITLKLDEIIDFSGVSKFIDTPVKRYSSGMYVRLAFAVASSLESDIMIIDEVLAVGDSEFQQKCIGKMRDLTQGGGKTVLFVSHNMATIKSLCTKAIYLEKGRLLAQGLTRDVVDMYVAKNNLMIEETDLADRKDRSGSQKVKLVGFHMEDEHGAHIETILTGTSVAFCFHYQLNDSSVRTVDLGMSFHDLDGAAVSVIYSGYQNILFSKLPPKGQIRCMIHDFNISKGRYNVGGRILADSEEADWPQGGLAIVDVEDGDFYHSGKTGFPFSNLNLIRGDWSNT